MKKQKTMHWIIFSLLIIGLGSFGRLLHGQSDLASVSPASSAYMWRVLYADAAGNTHLVNEDGTGNKILCNGGLPEAVDASLGRFVFTQRINANVWRIFSANLDMSDVKSLAQLTGKNIFLYYDPKSKRVIFALNTYEEIKNDNGDKCGIRGNIYSVGILGGYPVKLANPYAVFHEIVGDRYVYTPSWETANRDLASVKLDNTGRANLTWSGDDDVYCGQFGDKVIFSRKTNGQTDLYAIPNYGGKMSNLKVLANSLDNERFGGTSAGSGLANCSLVFYHRFNGQTGEWSLYRVNLDGSGTFPIVTPADAYFGFVGNYIIYGGDKKYRTVKSDGTNQADLYSEGGHSGKFFCIMDGRAVYDFGGEWGVTVFSTLANGASPLVLFPKQICPALFGSQEARRIISFNSQINELKSIKANGSYPATIGYPGVAKQYLGSTVNRHIYAQLFGEYWTLYSQGVNGGSQCILSDSLFVDADGIVKPILRF